MLKYKRIILKISGEALSGEQKFGLSNEVIDELVSQLQKVHEMGCEIGIVVGGGNFWRGRQAVGMDKSTADHMGMLATVINALALQDALERCDIPCRVQTALTITRVAEPYILRKALRHLEKGRIVIFACGTGNPYFTTDTGAALRAAEIHAQALLLAKNVDGIYDSDPEVNPSAKRFDKISYLDIINKDLKAMDLTAVTMCKDQKIPIIFFSLTEKDAIQKVVNGETIGTVID